MLARLTELAVNLLLWRVRRDLFGIKTTTGVWSKRQTRKRWKISRSDCALKENNFCQASLMWKPENVSKTTVNRKLNRTRRINSVCDCIHVSLCMWLDACDYTYLVVRTSSYARHPMHVILCTCSVVNLTF